MINLTIEAARRAPRKNLVQGEKRFVAATLLQIAKLQLAAEQRTVLTPTITRVPQPNPSLDLLSNVLPNTVVRVTTYPEQSTRDETTMDIVLLRTHELQQLEAEGQPIDAAVIKYVLTRELVSNDITTLMGLLKPELPTYAERNASKAVGE